MVASPPGPRSRLPRPERERQVVDAAHALFAQRGYRDVTMDAVAAAVGVTKPLLYAYFGNKEQLYLACVARTGDELAAAIDAAVDAAPTPGDALKAALRTFFALVERDEPAWRVLHDESLPTAGVVAEAIDGYRARIAAPVARAFRALPGGPADARATAQAEALAHGQLAAAEAMSRWWLRTGALPAGDLAELLIDTLEPGLAQRALAGRPAHDQGPPT
jgi:AcrR family transcriptional regulator